MKTNTLISLESLPYTARCLKNAVLNADESRHSDEVAHYSLILGKRIGLNKDDLLILQSVALIHDIGKGGIMEIISEGRILTEDEAGIVKRHPGNTMHMLCRTNDPLLAKIGTVAVTHHEKWDGTGYPYGMMGMEIPLLGRILAVSDNWSAIKSDRPYRPAFSDTEALEMMAGESGKKFDPQVLEHFLDAHRAGEFSVQIDSDQGE